MSAVKDYVNQLRAEDGLPPVEDESLRSFFERMNPQGQLHIKCELDRLLALPWPTVTPPKTGDAA